MIAGGLGRMTIERFDFEERLGGWRRVFRVCVAFQG